MRNGLYAELIGQLLAPRNGVITAPFGHGQIAAVARQDLAEAFAVGARAPSAHVGKTYNMVGETTITGQRVADRLRAEYRPGTLEDLRASLNGSQLSAFQPSMLLSIHSAAAHGFLADTTTDIHEVLSRRPVDPLKVAAYVAGAVGR